MIYEVTFVIKKTSEEKSEKVRIYGDQDKSGQAKKTVEDSYRGKGMKIRVTSVKIN